MVEDRRTKISRTFRPNIIGGVPSYTWTPPTPSLLPSTTSSTVRKIETSGAGTTGRKDSGEASQALVGACWRRVVSEGSLPLKLAGSLDTKQIQRGGKVRR